MGYHREGFPRLYLDNFFLVLLDCGDFDRGNSPSNLKICG